MADVPQGFQPVGQAQDEIPAGFTPVDQAPQPAPSTDEIPPGFTPVDASELRPINSSPDGFLSRVTNGSAIKDWVYDHAAKAANAGWAEAKEDAKSAWEKLSQGYEDSWSQDFWTRFLAPAKAAGGALEAAALPATIPIGLAGRGLETITNGWSTRSDLFTALMALPAGRGPLVEAGGGQFARLEAKPDGTIGAKVIGTYPPTHVDFENAAASIVSDHQKNLGMALPTNMRGVQLASEEAGLKARHAELSASLESAPAGDQVAADRLNRLNAIEQQIANTKDTDTAALKKLKERRDQILVDTNPEQLRAAAEPISQRRDLEAEHARISQRLGEIAVERSQMPPPAALGQARPVMLEKLHRAWEEKGIHPAEIADRVKDDPVMAHDLSAAHSPDLPLPEKPSPQFVKEMDDKFYRLKGAATADKAEFLQRIDQMPASIKDPEVQELWYRHMEGDPTVTMPPELGRQYNEIMGPLKKEEAQLWEDAKGTNLDIAELNPNYAHRIVAGKNPQIDRLTGEAATDENPIYNGAGLLARSTSSMESRRFYALEDEAGNRQLVAITKDGDLMAIAKGEKRELAKDAGDASVGSTFDIDGRTWTLGHALTSEIEGATSLKYYKNALANTIDNILHLRAVNRAVYTVQSLRDTPEWAKYTARRGAEGVPADWKTPQLSLFTNDVMHPYLAEVADDFYGRKPVDGLSATLQKVNRFAVGSLFWTPIPHIANAGTHWALERSWDWITPGGMKSLAVDGARAIRAVATQNGTYQRMLRDGSGLIYGGVANRDFYAKMLRDTGMELAKTDEFAGLAKTLGMAPVKLISSIYNASSKALWAVSDMFMVQRLLELERKGVAPRQAIEMAERHIPNYRIPPRLLGSRALKQTFSNPFLFNFSRYHYGVLKGFANLAKEITSGNPEDMSHAAGAIMAFGVIQLAVWPALSALLQKITNDESFSVPSYGPGRLVRPIIGAIVANTPDVWPEWVKAYYKDNPEFLAQLSNMVVFSPILNFATEEYQNRYNFSGRSITEPADWRKATDSAMQGEPDTGAWANVARTQGEHAAQQLFLPYNTVNQAWRKGLDPGTALIQGLFGVQYTTPEQEAGKARAFRYQDRQAIRRQRKPIGLIENIGR